MDQTTLETRVAVAAVRSAVSVCQAVQQNLVDAQTLQKKDRSPVTVADFASQALVCGLLGAHLPNDPLVAEEDSRELRHPQQRSVLKAVVEHVRAAMGKETDESQILAWIDRGGADASTERFWTLDPIDGTKGFLRRQQYAVALALIDAGRIVLGVLGCPNLPVHDDYGALLVAVRGQGTRLLPLDAVDLQGATAVKVSHITNAAEARFCESVESGHSDQSQSAQIASRLGITAEPVRMDSQAKYAAVSRGDAAIYLRLPTSSSYRENIWDHAAGTIVVEEAGGCVTDIDGKGLDYTHGRQLSANRGVVATNGSLHEMVLDAIRQLIH